VESSHRSPYIQLRLVEEMEQFDRIKDKNEISRTLEQRCDSGPSPARQTHRVFTFFWCKAKKVLLEELEK
jgi:hypothetical protein